MPKSQKKIISWIKRHKIKLSMFLIIGILWFFSLPSPLFDAPTATVVESDDGRLLGARIAVDGQWRFPEVDTVPQRFETCLLLFEDEYFYKHPGFNPISILKAFQNNILRKNRRGASTLSQQLIRLSRKNKKRTYFEKVIELIQTTRLEAGYSKKSILKLYASHAPFGGNVVGLETASWRYFGIPAEELSWGQAAALAVLPNAPALIFPGKNEVFLKQKRDRLLLKLYERKIIDATTLELAKAESLPGKPMPLPDIAPHFVEKVRKEHNGKRLVTTIDYHLQQKINAIVKSRFQDLRQNEIHNMAVLILDVESKEILAYVGNSPTTAAHKNYVDIIQKPRSTGSVLKPFLFASMLETGELLPEELVADVPTSINGYNPQNFDRKFYGAVPANVALARSLNVPAVRMLREYGVQRFYNVLKKTGQEAIRKTPDYYGLSLILGGAESNLWDLTKTYAAMAATVTQYHATSGKYRNNEYLRNPTYIRTNHKSEKSELQDEPPLWKAGAVFTTLEAMQKVNRPSGEEAWEFYTESKPIAWKTGTSYGFKDAWAIGVTPKYAIGVWVGNSTGEGRPGLTGILAAAPVLFDALKVLPASGWFSPPYDEMVEGTICSESGFIAGLYCDKVKKQWIPTNGMRAPACPYHQQIFVDASETFRVNSSCEDLAEMKQKNWFSLPPMMEFFYAPHHPEYKPLPPFRFNCIQENVSILAFIYPKRNETVILPKNFDESLGEVVFKVAHRFSETTLYWYLDSEFLGQTENFHELALTPKPGTYQLTVVDPQGNSIQEIVTIKHL